MCKLKLLMFDLDDTLYDFTESWTKGLKRTFRSFPRMADLDQKQLYTRYLHYSNSLWELVESSQATYDEYRFLRLSCTLNTFNRTLNQEQFKQFNDAFIRHHMAAIQADRALLPMMTRLAAACQLAIVTNGPADTSMDKVAALGLSRLFREETVFISEKVGYAKPDLRIYKHVLDKFSVRAEEAMFIGDTWHADVAGPIQAGMQAIWYNPKGKEPATAHQPWRIAASLSELDKALAERLKS